MSVTKGLSDATWETLTLMGAGWELGRNNTLSARHYLQKGGFSQGGRSQKMTAKAVHVMEDLGLIEKIFHRYRPYTVWKLTEFGRQMLRVRRWKEKAHAAKAQK